MIYDFLNMSAFLIAAIVILLLVLIYTLVVRRNDRFRNKVFIMMLVFSLLCACCEMGKELVRFRIAEPARVLLILDILEYFHSFFHVLIPVFFSYYIIRANGSHRHMNRLLVIVFFAPGFLSELMVLSNPLHHKMYYHDENMVLHGGICMTAAYVIAVMYIIAGAVNLIEHRYAMARRRVYSMLLFFPVSLTGMSLQLIYNYTKCEIFAISLTMLGIMLTMENENERMDMACGVYNRNELRLFLGNVLRLDIRFHVITIRLTNYDILMRLSGTNGVDPIMSAVAACLVKEYNWYRIYRSSITSFMILSDMSAEEVERLSEKLYVRFLEGVYVEGIDTPVAVRMMRAAIPGDLSNIEDVMLMVDGPLPPYEGRGIICGEKLKYLTRSNDLEEAMDRGLKNGGFSIYYQSVHKIGDLEICGIKALVRLKDEKLGTLMPGEFIPQAERTGQIRQIGDFVLGEVCSFIKSGGLKRIGCNKIYVNLSFVQCMSPDYAVHVINLVESYGVDPSRIMFEITKPVNKEDFEILQRFMKMLKTRGFGFLMEDFGSGYANVEAIFTLDFDIVKIDRSILWEAVKSESGRVVLENSIKMIKELDRGILAEGVENSAQIDMLKALEVDYLQGYYFSKPMPADKVEEMTAKR